MITVHNEIGDNVHVQSNYANILKIHMKVAITTMRGLSRKVIDRLFILRSLGTLTSD